MAMVRSTVTRLGNGSVGARCALALVLNQRPEIEGEMELIRED